MAERDHEDRGGGQMNAARLLAPAALAAMFLTPFLPAGAARADVAGAARVIDGDTIEVAGQRVRLYGIDAPETRQTCGKRWRCGARASKALAARIGQRRVACKAKGRDRYKRLVAVCRAGGRDLGAWMVEQDPADEPASEQISRISEAKSAVKGRKGSRAKGLPALAAIEAEQLLTGWTPVRLNDLAVSMRYGTSIKCDYDEALIPVLRIPNVSSGQISLKDLKFGPLNEGAREALALMSGDLLMIRSNGSLDIVGRSAVVTPDAEGMSFAGYLVRLRTLNEQLNTRYVWLALNSHAAREQIERPIRSAVGLKNVNLTEFGNLSFWLPPLAEQHRIVAKVDELMVLCDRLEANLTNADTARCHLLESLLHENLAPIGYNDLADASPVLIARDNAEDTVNCPSAPHERPHI